LIGRVHFACIRPAVTTHCGHAIRHSVRAPETRKRLEALAFDPIGETPKAFGTLIRAEVVRFGRAVKASGVTVN